MKHVMEIFKNCGKVWLSYMLKIILLGTSSQSDEFVRVRRVLEK
jgi:hypothetical protein